MTTTTETQATSQDASVRRPLSISQLQLWYRCGYAWHLRYGLGHSPRAGAGAWFGRITHETIGLMYRGMRMDAAHTEVWTRECGPVWGDLQQLVALDAAYAAQGRPTTNAAKAWRAGHPEYDQVLARLLDFQQHGLGHARWGKTQSLADYYRRAVALRDSEGEILLENPLLVEGIPVAELATAESDAARASHSAESIVELDDEQPYAKTNMRAAPETRPKDFFNILIASSPHRGRWAAKPTKSPKGRGSVWGPLP